MSFLKVENGYNWLMSLKMIIILIPLALIYYVVKTPKILVNKYIALCRMPDQIAPRGIKLLVLQRFKIDQ